MVHSLTKLSKEFEVHCRNDISKRCIIFPKYILECLNVWPDNKSALKKWFTMFVIINLGIMGFGQIGYLFMNSTGISQIALSVSTISTTYETMAKLFTMIYLRDQLHEILVIVWHEFWPAYLVPKERQTEIKWRSNYITFTTVIFLIIDAFSSSQFMSQKLIFNIYQLPLESWFPFNFMASPVYEIMYIWQWILNQFVASVLPGFDTFFNSLIMICATQFIVLQVVIENMFTKDFQWEILFGKKDVGEEEVMIKCVQHHIKLMKFSRLVDKLFSQILFLQVILSTFGICLSATALMNDSSVIPQMLPFCIARLVQFYLYCSVGNELTYHSGQMADAAYKCDWEQSENYKIRLGLMMIIQRAQKPESITVAGMLQLNLTSFISAVQMSFSFYTLLDSFL